jgi:hypothetical protein
MITCRYPTYRPSSEAVVFARNHLQAVVHSVKVGLGEGRQTDLILLL